MPALSHAGFTVASSADAKKGDQRRRTLPLSPGLPAPAARPGGGLSNLLRGAGAERASVQTHAHASPAASPAADSDADGFGRSLEVGSLGRARASAGRSPLGMGGGDGSFSKSPFGGALSMSVPSGGPAAGRRRAPSDPVWKPARVRSAEAEAGAGAGLDEAGNSPAEYGDEGSSLASEALAAARKQRARKAAEEIKAELAEASRRAPLLAESNAVRRAYVFARSVHEDESVARAGGRFAARNGETYAAMCIGVAEILAHTGMDETTVAAGMLHAALDHSMCTHSDLCSTAGADVAGIAALAARAVRATEQQLPSTDSEEGLLMAEQLREMLLGIDDARAMLVALAVRLHELRNLDAWGVSAQDQVTLARETLALLTPLADSIGVWGLKAEMEDLCFRVVEPVAYEHLRRDVGRLTDTQRQGVGAEVQRIADELDARGIPYEDIHGRKKGLYSIWRKMCAKGKRVDQVLDKRGVRIITSTEEDCYRAMAAIKDVYQPIKKPRKHPTADPDSAYRVKDYIASPKPNGYRSIHATVAMMPGGETLEVQVRSAEMHFAAEWGMAAHWRYKEASAGAATAAASQGEGGAQAQVGSRSSLDRKVTWARFMLSQYTETVCGRERLQRPSTGAARQGGGGGGGGSSPLETAAARALEAEVGAPASQEAEPVLVIERVRGAPVAVRTLPPGATAADLLSSSPGDMGRARLVVNETHVTSSGAQANVQLSTGDLIEWEAASESDGEGEDRVLRSLRSNTSDIDHATLVEAGRRACARRARAYRTALDRTEMQGAL